jgi:hypothetical protein
MDDQRFDRLARALASGVSRRSVLRGFLGIGGVLTGGIAVEQAHARTVSTRPRVPPPPPPQPTPTPACGPGEVVCGGGCCPVGFCTSEGTCCQAGQELCPGGAICCDPGACARSGNTDYCCAGAPCGFDCCDDPLQCCDGSCCPAGAVCLTKAFGGEGRFIEEETCCPVARTCDSQCCSGECYDPTGQFVPGSGNGGIDTSGFSRLCCPAGFEVCDNPDGTRSCIDPATQCCGVADCVAFGFDADCVTCNQQNFCEAMNAGLICNGSECGTCQDGRCLANPSICPSACAPCGASLTCEPVECPAGQRCCGGTCAECCEPIDCVNDTDTCEDGRCCQAAGRCNPADHRCCGACTLGGPDNTGFCGAIELCGGSQCPAGQRCCGDVCAECCETADCPHVADICRDGSCCRIEGRCGSGVQCCGSCEPTGSDGTLRCV